MIKITEQMAELGGICPVCGKYYRPNGVGPESEPALTTVLDSLPSSSVLRYGVRFHDWLYHLGLAAGSRQQADMVMYLKNEAAIKNHCSWWNAWYYRLCNKRNYAFVRKFGDEYFNHNGCKGIDMGCGGKKPKKPSPKPKK